MSLKDPFRDQTLVFDTEDQINFFRFASLKHQLKLEGRGLRSSGGALRPRLAAEFGLGPRDDRHFYIDYCQARMDEIKAKLNPGVSVVDVPADDPLANIPRDADGNILWESQANPDAKKS
jgi:hypothetical protein